MRARMTNTTDFSAGALMQVKRLLPSGVEFTRKEVSHAKKTPIHPNPDSRYHQHAGRSIRPSVATSTDLRSGSLAHVGIRDAVLVDASIFRICGISAAARDRDTGSRGSAAARLPLMTAVRSPEILVC